MKSIIGELASPKVNLPTLATRVIRAPQLVEALLEGLSSPSARIKYRSAKLLAVLSERSPVLLYPYFDLFVRLFDGDNRILRWNAMRILGNLAPVDDCGRLEPLLGRFFAPILGEELIDANSVIAAAPAIALAKPHLADQIAACILNVSRANYATRECRNIAIGRAIDSFDGLIMLVKQREPITEFVRRQLRNPRPATRRRAERFLKKWNAHEPHLHTAPPAGSPLPATPTEAQRAMH